MKLYQKLAAVLAAWLCWGALPSTALAQCPAPTARVLRLDGVVEHKAKSASGFTPARVNLDVCLGDSIRTGERSRVTIVFVDDTRLVIDQNTEWVVRPPSTPGRTLIDLVRGAILFFARQPRSLDVKTPFANAAVEGTEFLVRVEADRTFISVFEGHVSATNEQGSLTLTRDESAIAIQGQAPQRQVVVRPRDAVQWALYYEPILPADSLEQLDKVPEPERNAHFFVRRASVLLGAGRLDEARGDLDRASTLDPKDGDVDALRAIIAIAQNDRAAALTSGREAVGHSPKSAAARLALSYALQANVQLEAARDEMLEAVADHPDDARALARLAELELSLGYVDPASNAARRAVALAPDDARPNTVLGYAALARMDTKGAKVAFERAISLEPGGPLARLGLGLARIREGHLAEGRREIEIAVALNPEDPILRSYLGKAYFDEKRDDLAAREFERAKQLDPLDPTPWFYQAIAEQTINRPIEALEDLQGSIDRNGNRAVYRSRLLLDDDLAARGAKLSRIYEDLGFEQLALLEGWKSLDADPANHSAHRLLSDNYLALPSHQIARDSELLQSQLLQPLNINAVQPRLADNGLSFLDDIGTSAVGFNEYSRLFTSNELRVIAQGLGGTDDTDMENAIVSGIFNRISFSLGHFRFNTDGVRENDDATQTISNVFVQAEVARGTSLGLEYRNTDTEQGDRTLLFDPGFFQPELRSIGHAESVRLNLRQTFTPAATLIGTFVRQSEQSSLAVGDFNVHDNDDTNFLEMRYLQHWKRVNLTGGFGALWASGTHQLALGPESPPPEPIDERHSNGYVYASLSLPKDVTLTTGLSGDALSDPVIGDRRQVNPKLGITWAATPRTVIRAAAFRVLNRTLIASQTIEPTQVSGFNQFFDDAVGTRVTRYGVAADQGVWANGYVGAEFSQRNLAVPAFEPATGSIVEGSFRERIGRAYLYSLLARRMALSVEYRLTHFFDPEGNNPLLLQKSTTNQLPIQLRYFGPRGFFAGVRGTYVRQEGVFTFMDSGLSPGASDFWTADLSAGYRLPRRWGQAAVDIRNLFDRQFRFQDANPMDPTIVPKRQVFARLSVTF
jgi:tetratricopeptide (TPR) repeat protein